MLLIGLVLASVGCAQTSVSVSTGAPVTTTAASSGASMTTVGQPVTATGGGATVTLTVLSVRYHTRSPGQFDVAPVNGRYAVADVRVSVSAGSYDYNEASFGYQTPDARVYGFADGHAAVAGFGPGLNSGTLGAGQSKRGFVTFDVPRGPGQDVQVTDPGGSILAEWKLG